MYVFFISDPHKTLKQIYTTVKPRYNEIEVWSDIEDHFLTFYYFWGTLAPEVRSQNQGEIDRAYRLIRLVVFSSHGALRLVDVASPRIISIYKKKISSGTHGTSGAEDVVISKFRCTYFFIKIVETTLQ